MKMGLLKSVDNVPGIDYYEYRDIDYFNKFKYRARVRFEGLSFTYWAADIDTYLKKINSERYMFRKVNKNDILKNLKTIENFIQFKNSVKSDDDVIIRIEGDTAGIFSNDLSKLTVLKKIGDLQIDFTEAVTSQYSGVKHFVREPVHKYRVYLRSTPVELTLIHDLRDTLSKNKSLYPSKSLTQWLYKTRQMSWSYRYCSSTFSIDYDDEGMLSYLALVHGDILGKKYKLEKRPDPI